MRETLRPRGLVHHGHEQHLKRPEPSGMRDMVGTANLHRGLLASRRNNNGTWHCTALVGHRTTAKHLHHRQSRTGGKRQSLPPPRPLYWDLSVYGCPRPQLAAGNLTIHRRQIA